MSIPSRFVVPYLGDEWPEDQRESLRHVLIGPRYLHHPHTSRVAFLRMNGDGNIELVATDDDRKHKVLLTVNGQTGAVSAGGAYTNLGSTSDPGR